MSLSRRRLLAVLPAAILAGCGFQLRGTKSGNLPYKTMLIALPETADVRIWLERYINSAGSTEIVDDPKQAEATFQQLSDSRLKTILSVNAQGRVREYRLQLNYSFRVINAKRIYIFSVKRAMSNNDIVHLGVEILIERD